MEMCEWECGRGVGRDDANHLGKRAWPGICPGWPAEAEDLFIYQPPIAGGAPLRWVSTSQLTGLSGPVSIYKLLP